AAGVDGSRHERQRAPGAGLANAQATAPLTITAASRLSHLDVRTLAHPPRLIMNPHAGQKLGVATNASNADAVLAALHAAGIDATLYPTKRPGHATELAREAVNDGCKLIIAAGGDGTVSEAAQG